MKDSTTTAAPGEAVEMLLWFGASMLGRAIPPPGQWIEVTARKMGFDAVSASLSLEGITASVRRMHHLFEPNIDVYDVRFTGRSHVESASFE